RGVVDQKALDDGLETMTVEKEICERYLELIAPTAEANPAKNYANYSSINWHMMRGGAQFLPQVVMGVVLMFGVLTLAIAFIIITHGVRNFIVRNMKNTGALEAAGYTPSMLRLALVMQIVLVALIGSILGVALGILTSGFFGDIVSGVLGLTWNQPIHWPVAVLTVVGMVLVTYLIAMLIGRVYKKITVLDALRGGINTHNYKKNHFPLDKSSLPLPVTMSLKNTFGSVRNSILLIVIAALLTIAMTAGFGMYESFGAKPESLLEIMGMEGGKVYISNGDISFAEEYRKMAGVTNVLLQKGFEPTVIHGDKEKSAFTYVVDDVNHRQYLKLLEGRVPVHDNEIMLTQALAEDLGVSIGDVVTVKNGTKTADYIVTGFDQRMERMGRTMNVTIEGGKRLLGEFTRMDILIYADDNTTFEELEAKVKEIAAAHEDTEYVIINSDKNMTSTMGTVSSALRMVCIIIAVVTLFIVIFTEALLIRAKITREWRSMGINKALGATSGQLILEIMLSNLPALLLGSLLGVLVSDFAGQGLCKGIFSLFGLKKIDFLTPIHWKALTVVSIVVVAALTSAIIGLRVRSMKPVEMITEE
ncbi:MAG: ABC transporter permease, partial [Lachnospiraceae bacterium]|nr:ABC transporter permease [Lachnospiraceae bacterium]